MLKNEEREKYLQAQEEEPKSFGDKLVPGTLNKTYPPTTIEIVHGILDQAMKEVGARATTYDKPQGEESMPHVIELFNALYRTNLTVEQGWMFMCLLKIVRSASGDFKRDNYVDLAAYAAFTAKAAMDERSGGES